eukprot:RCo018792
MVRRATGGDELLHHHPRASLGWRGVCCGPLRSAAVVVGPPRCGQREEVLCVLGGCSGRSAPALNFTVVNSSHLLAHNVSLPPDQYLLCHSVGGQGGPWWVTASTPLSVGGVVAVQLASNPPLQYLPFTVSISGLYLNASEQYYVAPAGTLCASLPLSTPGTPVQFNTTGWPWVQVLLPTQNLSCGAYPVCRLVSGASTSTAVGVATVNGVAGYSLSTAAVADNVEFTVVVQGYNLTTGDLFELTPASSGGCSGLVGYDVLPFMLRSASESGAEPLAPSVPITATVRGQKLLAGVYLLCYRLYGDPRGWASVGPPVVVQGPLWFEALPVDPQRSTDFSVALHGLN